LSTIARTVGIRTPRIVADDVAGGDLGEVAADAEDERRAGRHRRLAAEEQIQRDEADDRDEKRDAQESKENRDTATSHGCTTSHAKAASSQSVVLCVCGLASFPTSIAVGETTPRNLRTATSSGSRNLRWFRRRISSEPEDWLNDLEGAEGKVY
jgi:hypothetical protein